MLSIAGQTAGPIGLTFFVDTHGCYRLKKFDFFSNIFFNFFYGQRRALQLVTNIIDRYQNNLDANVMADGFYQVKPLNIKF